MPVNDPTPEERNLNLPDVLATFLGSLCGDYDDKNGVLYASAKYHRMADVLLAAGFGDVAAERAEREHWFQKYTAVEAEAARLADIATECDALQARIDAVERLIAPQWRSMSYDRNALIDDLRAALAGDQPAAAPEACRTCGRIEGHDGATHDAVSADRPAPEPPHLDPWPIIERGGGIRVGYRKFLLLEGDEFAPRPADENGKPYSQNRADYEEQGR